MIRIAFWLIIGNQGRVMIPVDFDKGSTLANTLTEKYGAPSQPHTAKKDAEDECF